MIASPVVTLAVFSETFRAVHAFLNRAVRNLLETRSISFGRLQDVNDLGLGLFTQALGTHLLRFFKQ